MFGQRLKSWMEAHLGRPRHKSTSHQNQKQRTSSKESSSLHSSGTGTTTSTSLIANSSTVSKPNSSSTPTSHNLQSHLHSTEKNCNSNRNPSEDFPSTTAATSSSALQAQQQHLQGHGDEDQEHLDQEQLHHLNQHQQLQRHTAQLRANQQHQQQQPSASTAILLGSFNNNLNLSSPDTGYSTDGYSPKSVYPALSFESSGKSTPKSSYTISSLVSSERLHLNNSSSCTSSKSICGGPSKNSSISNGLELEEDEEEVCCDIPNGDPSSMQTESSATATHSDPTIPEQSDRARKDEECDGQGNHDSQAVPGTGSELKDETSRNLQLRTYTNADNLETSTECSKTQSSGVSAINANRTLLPSTESTARKTLESEEELIASNSKASISIQSKGFSCSDKHEHFNHRRTESMDGQRVRHEGIEISSSSSKVTAVGARNIRTSLLLTSSSDIPPECNPGLKNAFSLCSPRRQRTRIKTNPWISLTQHHDINFHVKYRLNMNESGGVPASVDNACSAGTSNESAINSKSKNESSRHHVHLISGSPAVDDSQHNFMGLSVDEPSKRKMVSEINNKAGESEDGGVGIGVGVGNSEGCTEIPGNSTNVFYRISTSTSASDSGKGTLEPGTNRNSTESSCLLSDSTSNSGSARNSIISPENTISSGSVIIPNINTVHARLDHCVSNLASVQGNSVPKPSSSSSGSVAVKPPSATPSICITNSTKPSVKRLNSISSTTGEGKVKSGSGGKRTEVVSAVSSGPGSLCRGVPCTNRYGTENNSHSHNMVDKETDILSDWANTDDDDGEEDGEDDEDEDGEEGEDEDDNECITPTPSSPDVTFNHSSSCSSKMDFIDVSDRVRHPNTSINIDGNNSGFMAGPYQHNMNLPTTCYQSVALSPKNCTKPLPVTIPIQIPDAYAYDHLNHRNQPIPLTTEPLANHVHGITTEATPAVTTARCLNTRITNSNHKSSNANNHNASHTIARGAIGFFRKMFKKGSSCSSHRNGGSSGFSGSKGKFLRSSRSSNGSHDEQENNDIDNSLIIPVGLLSPETVVVSNYPLSNTKPLSPAINGNFLTPTPNAFRRRSTGPGSDSAAGDGRASKLPHTKAIKTDIIRLPPQVTCSSSSFNSDSSANQLRHEPPSQSSSSTSHSNGNPVHPLSSYVSPSVPYYPLQSNTNSTTGSSSVHSMSIVSTSSMSMTDSHQNPKNPIFSQNHNIEDLIAYETFTQELSKPNSRQSPFLQTSHNANSVSNKYQNNGGSGSFGASNNNYNNHTSHSSPLLPAKLSQSQNQGMGIGMRDMRDIREAISSGAGTAKACSYDSPRLVTNNSSSSRINSPSFNNYSPIHRIVVTGGNHLLSRGGAPPVHGPPPPPSPAPSSSFHPNVSNNNHHHHSPLPPPRTPNSQFIHRPPTINSSPLINHRHSSTSNSVGNNGGPGPASSTTSYHHPFMTCSPSPILRNPRYQYITSSNQNSPLLNIPKRLSNVPLNNFPRGNVPGIPKVMSAGPAPPIFHSPSFTGAPTHNSNDNNYFSQNPSRSSPQNVVPNHHRHHHRTHIQNTNNTNHSQTSKGAYPPPPPTEGPDGFHQSHYYSSPITRDPSQSKFSRLNGMIPTGPERIYETVDDSEEDEIRSDEGDGEGGVFEFRVPDFGKEFARRESEARRQKGVGIFAESDTFAMINPHQGRNTTMNSGGSSSGGGGSGGSSQRCKLKSTSKSKSRRSKRESTFSPSQQPPLPPRSFPLMLGTYLSETETRLLEADRNTDRKYKRLISEAEALLREISIEKTQPLPWLSRYARESLRHDDCPQSDPLRRKAYDCWALRRLQQELAGCCASPPVLHRSRLHITSPVSPSQNRSLSLAQDHPEFQFMHDRRNSISSIHAHTRNDPPF